MKKSTLRKIIPLICVVAIALCSCSLSKKKEKAVKVDVSETVYGLEWGSSIEEVKSKMAEEGLEERPLLEDVGDKLCAYIVNDYNGTKGANGKIMYIFEDDGKLTSVAVYIKTSDGTDAKLVDKLKKAYEKAFDEMLNTRKDFSDTDNDYMIYWLGEESIVSIFGTDEKSLTISYTDKTSEPELVKELE